MDGQVVQHQVDLSLAQTGTELSKVLFELDLVHAFFVLLDKLDTILFANRDDAGHCFAACLFFVQTNRVRQRCPGVGLVRAGGEHHLVEVESLVACCLESPLLGVEVPDLLEPLGLFCDFDDLGQPDLLVRDLVAAVKLAQMVDCEAGQLKLELDLADPLVQR